MEKEINVFYIDKPESDHSLLKEIFQYSPEAYHLTEIFDRAQFDDYLKNERIDLILSDVEVLGFAPLDILANILSSNPFLPIIIITTIDSAKMAIEAIKKGATDYIVNCPEQIQTLPGVINQILKEIDEKKRRLEVQSRFSINETKTQYQANLLQKISEAVISTDNDLHIISWNHAAETIFGWTEQEVFGKPAQEILKSIYPAAIPESLIIELVGKGKLQGEIQIIRKDGSLIDLEISAYLVQDEHGGRNGSICICKDISIRTNRKKALEEEKNLLQSLMDTIPDSIYFKDLASRFIRINQAEARLFGLEDPSQAIGKSDFDFFSKQHAQQAFDDEQQIIKSGTPIINQVEQETWPDGHIGWVSTTKMGLLSPTGNIIGTFGISRNITEWKKTENDLVTVQQRMNLALDSAKMGLFEFNVISNSIWRTLRHDQIFGYGTLLPEWNLETTLNHVVEEDRHLLLDGLKSKDVHGIIECRIQRVDQKMRWVEIHAQNFFDETGKTIRILGTLQDITEKKINELALKQRIVELETVDKISDMLQNGGNVSELLNILIDETLAAIGLQDGCIWLQDLSSQRLETITTRGWFKDLAKFSFYNNEGICGHVFSSGKPYLSPDISKDRLVASRMRDLIKPAYSGAYVPIRSNRGMIGVLAVSAPVSRKITEDEHRLLAIISSLAGNTILRVSLFDQVQESLTRLEEEADQRKIFQDLLATEKEVLATTLMSIGEGVIATDEAGFIILFNHSAEIITGFQAAETLDKPINLILQILDPNTNQVIPNVIETLYQMDLAQKDNIHYRGPSILTKTGERLLVEGTISSIKSKGDKNIGQVLIFQDITEKQILEAQTILSQKMEAIGQLAAGIAHEINTPIQYVGDNLVYLTRAFTKYHEMLEIYQETAAKHVNISFNKADLDELEEIESQKKIKHYITEIPSAIQESLEGVERVRKIVLSIREFSHPSQKEKKLSDINHGIETTITISRNEWKYVADMETELDPDLPMVNCQIDEINQVILNMIVNSAQAIQDVVQKESGQKGKIKICTQNGGDKIFITIQDTGSGIPNSIMERIFDPFFTTKGIGKGTGQGLSMSHNIITKKHDGKIFVESSIGKGTKFTIELPIDHSKGEK